MSVIFPLYKERCLLDTYLKTPKKTTTNEQTTKKQSKNP